MNCFRVSMQAAIAALIAMIALPVWSQSADQQIVDDFMSLELAGWRLPEPTEDCLAKLSLQRLEPTAFGSSELIDQPELVDPPGPFYRIVRIEPDSSDRRRRIARIEWLLPNAAPLPDSFAYVLNDPANPRSTASMVREPERLVIRRECYNG